MRAAGVFLRGGIPEEIGNGERVLNVFHRYRIYFFVKIKMDSFSVLRLSFLRKMETVKWPVQFFRGYAWTNFVLSGNWRGNMPFVRSTMFVQYKIRK